MRTTMLFFLKVGRISGTIPRRGQSMPAARGYLAAALATAMAVAPSLAQNPARVPAKPSNDSKITQPREKLTLLEQVGDYSEVNPVVVIGIAKGQKETLLTGEQIGGKLSEALMKVHGAPSKYFVEPGGDYTAVIFAVDGHVYGPFGLKESLSGMTLAASNYHSKVRHGKFPAPGGAATVTAKPEPKQQ